MHRHWVNVARPTITRRRAQSESIRWANVGLTSTSVRDQSDHVPTFGHAILPGRPPPNVVHTQNAYAGPTLARRRHSNCDPSDHAPTLGQCRPVNHYPTSRTIKMHMLPQSWLDVDIPTMSNPTMRGLWVSVARPSITRRRPHSNAYMLAQRRNSDHDLSDHDAPTLGQGCLADHHPTSRTLKMPTLIR